MGLDMHAFTVPRAAAARTVDLELRDDMGVAELHYWRKHPNLHGWMEHLYYEKDGASDVFNCVTVELSVADLDRLETAIRQRSLPETSGFFFGASDGAEVEDDLAFVSKAREAIAAGLAVYYYSWW